MTESKSKGTVDNGEGSVTGPDPRVAPATSEEGEKSRQVAVLGDKKNTKKGLKECPSINQSINQQYLLVFVSGAPETMIGRYM